MNVRNAIVATAEGKQAQAQLQSQFAPKQNELQTLQKQIEDLQRKMSEGRAHAQRRRERQNAARGRASFPAPAARQ